MRKSKLIPPQFVIFLSMVYMTLFFASITVGYKIVAFGNELYCASVLIFPLLFPLSDALAELYGTSIAKSLIWYSVFCEAIFVGLTNAAISLPSPSFWQHQAVYDFMMAGYRHILCANVTAMILSFYLNIILLNKWKMLTQGRFYYLRSLGATAVGEITYTIITNVIAYAKVMSWQQIGNIIISDYVFKLVYSAVIAYPAALLVIYIKQKYQLSNQLDGFNPFQSRDIRKVVQLQNGLDGVHL